MSASRTTVLVVAAATFGLILGGTTAAAAISSSKSVKVCTTSKGVVRSASAKGKCPKKTKKKSVNVRGPAGARGASGPRGARGPAGPGAITLSAVHPATDTGSTEVSTPLGAIRFTCYSGLSHLFVTVPTGQGLFVSGTYGTGTVGSQPTTFISTDGLGNYQIPSNVAVQLNVVLVNIAKKTSESIDLVYRWDEANKRCILAGQVTPAG